MRALFFTLINNYWLHSSLDYDKYKYRGTREGSLRRAVVLLGCPLIFYALGLRTEGYFFVYMQPDCNYWFY